MRTMHLFAGHGGGLLADLILGHTPVVAVEWDRYACQVLRERTADGWFPGLRVWEGDVRLFDPSEYAGSVDCISAGFPCQDLSVAGKQAGLDDGTRSVLYREVLRIASIIKPRFIDLENVSAIIGLGIQRVLADLATMGYDSRWCCLRASEIGAWHHRDRWWLLASNDWSKRVHGKQQKKIQGIEIFPWGKNGGGIEELRKRSDVPYALVRGVRNGIPFYVDRIKGIGNAQIPLQKAVAWKILGGP